MFAYCPGTIRPVTADPSANARCEEGTGAVAGHDERLSIARPGKADVGSVVGHETVYNLQSAGSAVAR